MTAPKAKKTLGRRLHDLRVIAAVFGFSMTLAQLDDLLGEVERREPSAAKTNITINIRGEIGRWM